MLVLTRQKGQKVLIGDDVVVKVVEVKGKDSVVLAFVAPPHVRIDREEVRQAKQRASATVVPAGGRP